MKVRKKNGFKNLRKTIVTAITAVAGLCLVLGCFTMANYPNKTGMMMFLATEWILLLLYKNDFFLWQFDEEGNED